MDPGNEFKGEFAERLEYYGINRQPTRNHAIFAERAIRTLKEEARDRWEALDKPWHKTVDDIVEGYNEREHAAVGMAPNEVYKSENGREAHAAMTKKARTGRVRREQIGVGDEVQLLVKPDAGRANYRVAERAWTPKFYEVIKVENGDMGELFTVRGVADKLLRRDVRLAHRARRASRRPDAAPAPVRCRLLRKTPRSGDS